MLELLFGARNPDLLAYQLCNLAGALGLIGLAVFVFMKARRSI